MTLEEFIADERTTYATVRALEIIGEATKRLPLEVRALDPEIPWSDMARMRDRLIHLYDRVDPEIVWDVVLRDLTLLLPRIEDLQRLLEAREDEEWQREQVDVEE
jgi:uncharacterized protein with HEPN domain